MQRQIGALTLLTLAACGGGDAAPRPPAAAYTNILAEDYVGPASCGKCHPQNHATWLQHPHSRMNQAAGESAVRGDFSGASLSYAGGEVVFGRDGERFTMEYRRDGKALRTFRVTRTIGWRYLQEYVGVQTQGPEAPGDALYTEETRLKFGFMLKDKRWVPRSYLDAPDVGSEYLEDGRPRYDPFEPERTPFNARCIHCHNTYPYEDRLYSHERLLGFPPAPSTAISALLKARPERRGQFLNPTLPTSSLITIGISCESCHFGGREHARDPKVPVRFVPTHPALAGWTPDPTNARKNPAIVNALCRQCHFSGSGSWADGAALINSMESIEQDRGACRSQLRCIDCHNPHVKGPDAGAPDRPQHLAACTSCHGTLKDAAAQREHARHDPAKVSCLDCHMPRIVHGFDEMNRTHRISSPSEPAVLASGMPNACNLCHLDRSLAWTRDRLAEGWGKRVPLPRNLESVFGRDHSLPAGEAWLAQPMGMLRAVAGAAVARSPGAKQALPLLLQALDEPNAYTRVRALQNVERALGRKLEEKEYALAGPPEERRRQLDVLLKRFSGR